MPAIAIITDTDSSLPADIAARYGIQQVPISCRYVGFEIPPDFVIGYGLDLVGKYRNLPYVAVMEDEGI